VADKAIDVAIMANEIDKLVMANDRNELDKLVVASGLDELD
jgi:hypothetical protein